MKAPETVTPAHELRLWRVALLLLGWLLVLVPTFLWAAFSSPSQRRKWRVCFPARPCSRPSALFPSSLASAALTVLPLPRRLTTRCSGRPPAWGPSLALRAAFAGAAAELGAVRRYPRMLNRTLRNIFGPLIFAVGVLLTAWIAYHFFTGHLGTSSAWVPGTNAFVCLWVGWGWMRGEKVGAIRRPRA